MAPPHPGPEPFAADRPGFPIADAHGRCAASLSQPGAPCVISPNKHQLTISLFVARWRPLAANSSKKTVAVRGCALNSALGQSQLSDSGMGQEGRSQIGKLRFVPRCLSDKKLNNWIIGNRQRSLSEACHCKPMQMIARLSNQGGFHGGLKSVAALPRRAMITVPRTNLSIFVLRKQSKASSGLQKDA
jgi:hypothetical protein